MNGNLSTIAGIIGGLLIVLFELPIIVGGVGGPLFWLLFWLLLLGLAASAFFMITHRGAQH